MCQRNSHGLDVACVAQSLRRLRFMGENVVVSLKAIDKYRCMALVSRKSEVECESRSDVAYVAQSLRRLRFMGENVVVSLKVMDGYRCMALVSRMSQMECESPSDVTCA